MLLSSISSIFFSFNDVILYKGYEVIGHYLSFSQTDSKFVFLNGFFIEFCNLFPLDVDFL